MFVNQFNQSQKNAGDYIFIRNVICDKTFGLQMKMISKYISYFNRKINFIMKLKRKIEISDK